MPNPKINEMQEYLRDNLNSYSFVVIFGSYARGEAYSTSDLDVLIIDSKFNEWQVYDHDESTPLNLDWPDTFPPIHLVLCSKKEYEKRYCDEEEMAVKIAKDGYDVIETFRFSDYINSINCS